MKGKGTLAPRRQRDPNKPLGIIERRFIDAYLLEPIGRQAAISAGYAVKAAASQASELLKRPHVVTAIEAAMRARSEATGIDAQWVLREAVEIYQRCKGAVQPALHPKTRRQMRDADGKPSSFAGYSASMRRARMAQARWGKGSSGAFSMNPASGPGPARDSPDHIACDAASRSELVVPLVKGSDILGVLDLDSPKPARFDRHDQAGVERLAALYVAASAQP